jgi:hypothetical protein
MTEKLSPRRKSRPALASRILVGGASVAATIGLVGAMAAAGGPDAAPASAPTTSPQPSVRIVVVHKKAPAIRKASSVKTAPRVIRRYVSVPAAKKPAPTTKTSGS